MSKALPLAVALTACQLPTLVEVRAPRLDGERPRAASHTAAESPAPAPAARPAKHELGGMLDQYQSYTQRTLQNPNTTSYNDKQYTSAACWKDAKADGSPEGKQVCVAFDGWVKLLGIRKELSHDLYTLDLQREHQYAASDNNAKSFAEDVRTCTAAIDRAIADGAPADLAFEIHGVGTTLKLTLADARTQVCAAFDGAAKDAAAQAAVETARLDAIAKPYKAAGIAGDRLALVVDHDGAGFWGVGEVALSSPAQLARARVIFEQLSNTERGVWILVRYQFDGNKLVQTTTAEYALKPGAKAYK